jgi:hypothetical protein
MRLKLPILLAAATALCGWTAFATGAAAQQKSRQPITCVIELFTSQGCSSCPPADALLKSYTEREGVLALSFNVDIWDNLGWKDTLGKAQYTQRQRTYARTRGDGNVYTPQAMINGMAHAVGSDRASIDKHINATQSQRSTTLVALSTRTDADGVTINTAALADLPVDATFWLVKVTPRVDVLIERGENAGRTGTYYNVVREFSAIGSWAGTSKSTSLPRAALAGCTPGTCAILLQQGGTGSILGATWVPGPDGT